MIRNKSNKKGDVGICMLQLLIKNNLIKGVKVVNVYVAIYP